MKPKYMLVSPIVVILVITLACGQGTLPVSQTATQPPVTTPVQVSTQPPVKPTETLTPVPTGPCVNVFYPFVPGYQWIYKLDDGDDSTDDVTKLGLTVSSVDGSQAQVDALDLSSGVITHTTAECEDGAIKNYPLLTLGTLFGSFLGGELKVDYVSGVFMPAVRDLAAANWSMEWTGSYTASGTFTVTEDSDTTTLTLNGSPIQLEWSLAGQEPITVEAGTFDNAYKVTRKATVDVSIAVEGMNVKAKLIVTTKQWYAAGVGLLKNVIDSADLSYAGIKFPVEIKSRVELGEFRQGQ